MKKGGRWEQRTDKGNDNGEVRWYVISTSCSVRYVVARSTSLGKIPEWTMKLISGGRHSQYVGSLRPGQQCPPLTRGASHKALALRKTIGHPRKNINGPLRKGKTKSRNVIKAGKEGTSGRRVNPISSQTQVSRKFIEKARGRMGRKSLEKKERKPPPLAVGEKRRPVQVLRNPETWAARGTLSHDERRK